LKKHRDNPWAQCPGINPVFSKYKKKIFRKLKTKTKHGAGKKPAKRSGNSMIPRSQKAFK
jgi:hypothetical protein